MIVLKNTISELELKNQSLNNQISMHVDEMAKFKRSPYFFLGHKINNHDQRVMV